MAAEGKPPLPVHVANEEPLTVEVAAPEPPKPVVTATGELTLPPTTTAQEDKITAGQRLVNMLWEVTQSVIALMVVGSTMTKAFVLTHGQEIPTIMAVAFGTVVGFYFARTNHQAIGGIGKKANEEQTYRGR